MKYFMFVAGLLALLLSACGSAPAADPAQVQASVEAAVGTMNAMTRAAIPTDTPTLSPTDTPLPSPTPSLFPTPDPVASLTGADLTATSQSGGVNCLHPLDMGQAGPGHPTLVKNETAGPISISLNLYTPNAFGQCGAISYGNISKNGSVTAELPAGNWYAYAWARSKDNNFTTSLSFYVQPAQFLKLELCVRDGKIVYKQTC